MKTPQDQVRGGRGEGGGDFPASHRTGEYFFKWLSGVDVSVVFH